VSEEPKKEKNKGHYVVYEVHGFPGVKVSGPYRDQYTAEEQREDIRSYAGVHNCYITEFPPEGDKL